MQTVDLSETALDRPKNDAVYESDGGRCTVYEVVFQHGGGLSPHVHPTGEDCALVLSGTLTYSVSPDETIFASPGEFVLGRRNHVHGYANESNDPLHLLVFTAPERIGLSYQFDGDVSTRSTRKLSPPASTAETEFSTVSYTTAADASPEGCGTVDIFVDWNRGRIFVFDAEPLSRSLPAETPLLRYTTRS